MSAPKRRRLDTESEDQIASIVWDHYRNFLDSLNQQNGGEDDVGDIDELVELLEILVPYLRCASSSSDDLRPDRPFSSIASLLPVLASVAHYHLAAVRISETIDSCNDTEQQQQEIEKHLQQSLWHCDVNAATHSTQANYQRMRSQTSLRKIAEHYEKATTSAHVIRREALDLLESDTVKDNVKEWIELLLLDAIAGVEYVGDEEEDDDDDESDGAPEETGHLGQEDKDQDQSDFSCSAVESTARFMAAMLRSTLQQHDSALSHLRHFDLTHRLHPKVWLHQQHAMIRSDSTPSKDDPVCFTHSVLPNALYDRLCLVLAPDARYWKESDYAHRGYYSYYFDIDESKSPNNLMEDVIVNSLLPLAQQVLESRNEGDNIVGAEWWPHTRPVQANLGHQLHFDTDEALLASDGRITHPILSSVVYLTGGDATGATVILDQTPGSTSVAPRAWTSVPRNNTCMLFPGNLLHGVLPCPGDGTSIHGSTSPPHRLTFMVGFWTRRVPDGMKERRLYGPCGPLPPATNEHSWVKAIQVGYGGRQDLSNKSSSYDKALLTPTTLPQVSPAWEEISSSLGSSSPPLQLPKALDHRFFVRGAPDCFRDSLFRKDNDEEEDDDEAVVAEDE